MLLAEISSQYLVPIIAIGGSFAVAIVGILAWMIHATARSKQRETTRREVAAYVAEGSMTPDDAERILNAGEPEAGSSCRPKRA